MKVIVDNLIFLEWVKSLDFNIRISSYGLWNLNPISDLNEKIR